MDKTAGEWGRMGRWLIKFGIDIFLRRFKKKWKDTGDSTDSTEKRSTFLQPNKSSMGIQPASQRKYVAVAGYALGLDSLGRVNIDLDHWLMMVNDG